LTQPRRDLFRLVLPGASPSANAHVEHTHHLPLYDTFEHHYSHILGSSAAALIYCCIFIAKNSVHEPRTDAAHASALVARGTYTPRLLSITSRSETLSALPHLECVSLNTQLVHHIDNARLFSFSFSYLFVLTQHILILAPAAYELYDSA
jgi:hypothetical protein